MNETGTRRALGGGRAAGSEAKIEERSGQRLAKARQGQRGNGEENGRPNCAVRNQTPVGHQAGGARVMTGGGGMTGVGRHAETEENQQADEPARQP